MLNTYLQLVQHSLVHNKVLAMLQAVLQFLMEEKVRPLSAFVPKAMLAAPAYFLLILEAERTWKQFLRMTSIVVQLLV